MYLCILTLPFLGALTAGLLGRKIGALGAGYLTTSLIIVTALLGWIGYYEVALCGSSVSLKLGTWFSTELLDVSWAFLFDTLTVSIIVAVLTVSSLVHIFSLYYMALDPFQQRFFSYLSIFTGFMLVLVSGANYGLLFLGWEGIGVSSYLLVGFWFTRYQASKASIKALTVNRVGDIFLSLSFFLLYSGLGALDYSTVFSLAPYIKEDLLNLVGLLFLLAAMGKSAQLGLHTWLPSAIEGPTPVSALIHAATLVTAGVYLLLRSSPLLEYAPTSLLAISLVGTLTSLFAATTGLLQYDLKRVIAYSTCSQIGYLFIAVGLSHYNVALFHLINHAFFKALLFLGAGGILHSIRDQQDIRKLGGLFNILPFTYIAIIVGSFSLMAVPFLTGFYSKDLILELAYTQYWIKGHLAYYLGTLTASITAFYSIRLLCIVFLSRPNGTRLDYETTHDQPALVAVPYWILSILALFFGYLAKDMYTGIGSDYLGSALLSLVSNNLIEAELELPLWAKLLPTLGTLFGGLLALVLYNTRYLNLANIRDLKELYLKRVYYLFNSQYHFDLLYNRYIINGAFKLGKLLSKSIDKGAIENLGPLGLSNFLYNKAYNWSGFLSGDVIDYVKLLVLGFFCFIWLACLGTPNILLLLLLLLTLAI